MEHLQGEITKTDSAGKSYTFKFGWASYRRLSQITDLASFDTLPVADAIRLLLFTGLMSRQAVNKLPDSFGPDDMYELLDELSEADVKQVWEVGLYALGFTQRIIGAAAPADLQKVTAGENTAL